MRTEPRQNEFDFESSMAANVERRNGPILTITGNGELPTRRSGRATVFAGNDVTERHVSITTDEPVPVAGRVNTSS
jgi:hypothetical protein